MKNTIRKKVKNINRILGLKKTVFNKIKKDFSNMDLSKYDLSNIKPEDWNDAVFFNTNLSGTNIEFYPYNLRKGSMTNCNLSNNDLSYLKESNFNWVKMAGCDFTNTNLNIDFNKVGALESTALFHIKLDKSYDKKSESFWDNLNIDFSTLDLNPNIKISSAKIYEMIQKTLPSLGEIRYEEQYTKYVSLAEKYMNYDKSDSLIELYNIFKDMMDVEEKFYFFKGIINEMKLDNIDFSNIPIRLLEKIKFRECQLSNITFNNDIKSLMAMHSRTFDDTSSYKNIYFSSLNENSWKDLEDNRFSSSPITFRTSLYLELDRICNAKCLFCRNDSFDKVKYDLNKIKDNLILIHNNLDDIVVGGGEPTIRSRDLHELKKYISDIEHLSGSVRWTVFTNGTFNYEDLPRLDDRFYINLSRHAVDDDENARIFGIKKENILSQLQLFNIYNSAKRDITLCATCFEGGLDSYDKILDYIKWAGDLDYRKVLLSSLHKNHSLGNENINYNNINIDDRIFDDVINYLLGCNYERTIPIYSTGGYELIMVTNGFKTISFKRYIDKETFKRIWPTALKRTFDLSMNPAGEIFNNWHQSSGKIHIKK
jgi:MoaA/NifB/PqqE/SkfB family radical SAM enzyme